ncbi:MAG: hypothetical protein K8R67_07535 [Desulfobacteraceae bacterium]|nr:hypothetical protein [Desulfobacteraceae bacterium]
MNNNLNASFSLSSISEYSPFGKIVSFHNQNGTITYYDYETGRINFINTYYDFESIQNKHYIYSKAGDILEFINNVAGVTFTYEYDHFHRLLL